MNTDRDARAFLATALGDYSSEFDIEALLNALHQAADGWDFDRIPYDDFWAIVARHGAYTITVEASDAAGTVWQTMATTTTTTGDDADVVAARTGANQTVADGDNWRVRVWVGLAADTGTDPDAEYYPHR